MKLNGKAIIMVSVFISFILIFNNLILSKTISANFIPDNIKDFIHLRDKIAKTPEGGILMFIYALKLYMDKPEIGRKCLVIAVDKSQLEEGKTYKGYQLKSSLIYRIKQQLNRYPFVVNSYFSGSKPENGYFAKSPFQLTITSNPYSGNKDNGIIKLFVKSNGARSPRPIKMIRNNRGYWKAVEWSSIITGIKKPVVIINDNL